MLGAEIQEVGFAEQDPVGPQKGDHKISVFPGKGITSIQDVFQAILAIESG